MNAPTRTWVTLTLLVAVILAPVPMVIASFEQVSEQMVSHAFGTIALMCMSITLILSARPLGIDAAFAGLDKAYVVHKWLGISAFVMMLLHDTLEAEVKGIPDQFGFHDLASEMGVWVYNALLVLIVLTFLHLVPYRWWRISHKFMVAIFALSLAHFVLIPKPLALGGIGGLYILTFCTLGLIAAVFALRPRRLPNPVPYRVAAVEKRPGVTELTLNPEARGIVHIPGQFVFLRREGDTTLDAHPFTIRSAQTEDRTLHFSIAAQSGWTANLGDTVDVSDRFWINGPHGRFVYRPSQHRQIWLSAGIGITPTLAWADAGVAPQGPIDIVHICRSRASAPSLERLEAFAARHPEHVTLKVIETARTGRPDQHTLMRLLRDTHGRADIFFCGPASLENDVKLAIKTAKKAKFRFHKEEFQLRGGIRLPRPIRNAFETLGEGIGWRQMRGRLGL